MAVAPSIRSLPFPRLSSTAMIPRRISTTPCRLNEAVKAVEAAAAPAPSPVAPTSPQHNPAGDSSWRPLSYHVHRTPSYQFPVYQLAKRGGNLQLTKVRKIDGNVNAFRTDLREALGLKDQHVEINQLTKHVIIKGWRKADVIKFLKQMRF